MDRNMQACYAAGVGPGTNECYDDALEKCYYEKAGAIQLFATTHGCSNEEINGDECQELMMLSQMSDDHDI